MKLIITLLSGVILFGSILVGCGNGPDPVKGGTLQKFSSKAECQAFHLGVRDKLNYPQLYYPSYVNSEMKYTLNGKDLVIFCQFERMVVYPEGGWIKGIEERNALAAQARADYKVKSAKTVEKHGY